MKLQSSLRISLLTFVVAGIVGMSPALQAADMPDSDAVTKLLADARTQAYGVSVDAATLNSYLLSNLDWRTHATELTRMKEDINATGKTVAALVSARSQASPWQATAIDRILPFLREIADDTTAAIEYLNKNQSRLQMKEYKDYAQANSNTAQELATLIGHFVDFGNHKNRYESLKKTLEIAGK